MRTNTNGLLLCIEIALALASHWHPWVSEKLIEDGEEKMLILYRHLFLNKGKSKLKSYFTEAEEAYIQEADLDSNFQIYYIF